MSQQFNPMSGAFEYGENRVQSLLGIAGIDGAFPVQDLMLKDGADITPLDRELIVDACGNSPEKKIVVTHAIEGMIETADALRSQTKRLAGRTIALTGAIVPPDYTRVTDAVFNLGSGSAYAQSNLPGIYVAMQGKSFRAGNVRQDITTGFFRPILVPAKLR